LRQHVHANRGPIATEALDFLKSESRVKVKRGGIARAGDIEHCVRPGQGPAEASARQRRGDTPASPRRVHQHAAEVAASRSSRSRLIGGQLDDPAIADYLAVGLRDEHLAQLISDV
jgi:hypothetical protein